MADSGSTLQLVVLTSAVPVACEVERIGALLELGVARVHVRWPECSASELALNLRAVADHHRRRLVLHQHHGLAVELGVLGCHWRDGAPHPTDETPGFRSRACHGAQSLLDGCGRYDSLLAAPVFPSISKPGHAPVVLDWRLDELRALRAQRPGGRYSRACALGGVDRSNLRACQAMGFDEVAVLGSVWSNGDPLRNASMLLRAIAE